MQLLKRPFVRTILKYGALFLAVYIGYLVYTMDRNPPELVSFSISKSTLDPANGETTFEFSGEVTDERSVSLAEFYCASDKGDEFVLVNVLSGKDKYKVGFGKIKFSPDWSGSWDGNKLGIKFQGIGRLPKNVEPLSCNWRAELGDNLGNRQTIQLEKSLTIVSSY